MLCSTYFVDNRSFGGIIINDIHTEMAGDSGQC